MLTTEFGGCQCQSPDERARCLIACPNAGADTAEALNEIVGHMTFSDGSHAPLCRIDADELMARIDAETARRTADMPTEQDAIRRLHDAWLRLKDFGWVEPRYGPKNVLVSIIELGSTGIHQGSYEGEWAKGSWWIHDGDTWPSDPAMVRAIPDAEEPAA